MLKEIERQKKVISLMITSHSILRDKYISLSFLFQNGLIIVSVILNAFVFIDGIFIYKLLGINEDGQRSIIGLASIIVFSISIILLQVKWKEKAESHANAGDQLFLLMQELKEILLIDSELEKKAQYKIFYKKYTDVNSSIIKIPDHKFNNLKLSHKRKIELSKLIDKHPGGWLFILKIKLFLSSFKEKTD